MRLKRRKKSPRAPESTPSSPRLPYYNKPTQEGQYRHFKAIAEAVGDKPIILYNVPGRTAANLEPATLARLAEIPNIVGVKEASGNMTQIAEVINLVPETFLVFSGDDAVTLPGDRARRRRHHLRRVQRNSARNGSR